jgi:hypothetical protein
MCLSRHPCAQAYHDKSRPVYAARYGMLDEIVKMGGLRR